MTNFLLTPTIALLLGASILPTSLFSQNNSVEPCATTKVMDDLYKANPQLKSQMYLQEKKLQDAIKKQKAQRTTTNGPIFTIPVVVHVFHTGQASGSTDANYSNTVPNPTPAQIQAAVDLANSDYNKRTNKARYTGGDSTGVKFCLAKIDPNGTSIPSGAVTYHDGSQASTWTVTGVSNPAADANAYNSNGINSSNTNGISSTDLTKVVKWDPTRYYNIYLVTQIDGSHAGAGVKGFAYYPGSPNYDYAVMDPSSFSATSVTTFDHEMGHALGLRHSFAGANGVEDYTGASCPNQESACDVDGDYCCDIPEHKSSYPLFCSTIPADNTANSCPQATGSLASPAGTCGQFTHNYMNYGGCTNSFSADQAVRMRAIFGPGQFRENMALASNLTSCGCGAVASLANFTADNVSACAGSTINYTNSATGVISYKWSFPGGTPTTSTSASPAVQYNVSGTYNVTLIASNNSKSDTTTKANYITIYAYPTPSITIGGPTTFCQGDKVLLTASGGVTYQWSPSTGLDNTTSATVSAGPTVTTTYTVSVTNAGGCVSTINQVITVNTLPVAAITPNGPTTFCQGGSVILSASGGGTYMWSDGEMTASITATATNNYVVTVTNGNGCVAIASQMVTVNNTPTASITPNGSTTFCQGGSVTLTASGGNTYIWNTGETTSAIIATATNSYAVTVDNGCGTATASQTVTVNPNPKAIYTNDKDTVYLSQGGTVNFTSTSVNATAYNWNFDDGTGATTQNASHKYTVVGKYQVKLLVSNGPCLDSTIKTIVVLKNVGINELAAIAGINVFPNPANGQLNITQQQPGVITQIILCNILGQKQVEITHPVETNQLMDITRLPEGEYLLKIQTTKGEMTQKILIQR